MENVFGVNKIKIKNRVKKGIIVFMAFCFLISGTKKTGIGDNSMSAGWESIVLIFICRNMDLKSAYSWLWFLLQETIDKEEL